MSKPFTLKRDFLLKSPWKIYATHLVPTGEVQTLENVWENKEYGYMFGIWCVQNGWDGESPVIVDNREDWQRG